MKFPRKNKFSKETRRLLKLDDAYVSPSYTRDYPFIALKGDGMYLVDVDSNVFLDFTAGIAVNATGHSHPDVVKAVASQAKNMIHMSGTDFYYESQIHLAEKLANMATFMPHPTDKGKKTKVFFGNSGAEAVEAAMKLTRYVRKAPTYIAFYGAFHGRTLGALSLTASKPIQRSKFEPLYVVNHAPYANCKECTFNCKKEDCVANQSYDCINFIKDYILGKKVDPNDVAGIFVEPIQGEGGYVVPPEGWLNALVFLAWSNGIPVVFDEIQSGMGRTGKWWAHEHFGVYPDMMTTAKGIASGMSLGALIARPGLMEWPPGSHASTFGGNPISCAAALATIDVIEKENLLNNVNQMGKELHLGLEYLGSAFDVVENVRGLGLMKAIDISDGGEPMPDLRNEILMSCFDKGLLLLGCGKTGIRFCPSLMVGKREIDECITVLEDVLSDCV